MAERLIIQNFAGLDLDIELGRISLLIGPQASGKSVCAKCLYLFRSFAPSLLDAASRVQDKSAFEGQFLGRFSEYFPNLWRVGSEFRLRYDFDEMFVEITADKKAGNTIAKINYSSTLREVGDEMRDVIYKFRQLRATPRIGVNGKPIVFSFTDFMREQSVVREFYSQLENKISIKSKERQAFIIAGRAFLSTLKNNVLTVLADNATADPLLRHFIQLYETAKKYSGNGRVYAGSAGMGKLAESIIRGKLFIDGDEDYIELPDERRIPLANASSGQQEAFSLLMILFDLVRATDSPYSSLYAEEPEAHLYPESQWALARLMARVYNTASRPVDYVITTHSPYLLAVFNNLVYAHQVQQAVQDDPEALRRLSRVVPKDERLPLADFRAYALEGGKARSIISAADGLLVAADLDHVSEKVAAQFDKLLSLEPQAPRHGKAR